MELSVRLHDRWLVWPPLAGYLAACATATLVMAGYLLLRAISVGAPNVVSAFFGAMGFGLLLTFFIAAPGFVLLRLALHLSQRTGPVSFALAGAANAYALASLFLGADTLALYLRYPPDPAFAVAGAVGGLVCWWTEQRLSGRQD